jgi:plastocyanin
MSRPPQSLFGLTLLILAVAPRAPVLAQTGAPVVAQAGATVVGAVSLLDRGDQAPEDLGQAVVWLESATPASFHPVTPSMIIQDKQFLPHLLVVTVGSSVTFPNHDSFKHNVFSVSEAGAFDLGLYSRGDGKSAQFDKAGLIRVYCNVHATMSGFILVLASPWSAQAAGDGTFLLRDVAPGEYTLHAWHERAREVTQPLVVPEAGMTGVKIGLDASGYKFKPHLNKYGQPYTTQGRRY